MTDTSHLAPNHRRVFDALVAAGRPVTAYEIIDAVREDGITAPPTVYRALGRLIEEGLAHRLESRNAYVACAHGHHGHPAAAFVICETCGETVELSDPDVEARLKARATTVGFEVDSITLELRGRCAACRAAA
jgi:Fur family zinc uptake transcriptional regulator